VAVTYTIAPGYLAADASLAHVPIEAPREVRRAVRAGATPAEVATMLAWNRYGGLVAELGRRLRIDAACAVAVLCVESGGRAFGADGRVTIRFENHVFRRLLDPLRIQAFDRSFRIGGPQPWLGHSFRPRPGAPWAAFHGSQALEWRAYEVARAIDGDAAARSISMGLAQVMGFNHALVGYPSATAMLVAMGADVRFQVLALFDFIGGPAGARAAAVALRNEDLDRFATLYNGPGQARYYGELIAAHMVAFRRLNPSPGATDAVLPWTPSPVVVPSVPVDDLAAEVPREGYAHVVQPGDTLTAIARRSGSTVAALVRANDIERVDLIYAGQVIFTPRRLG